MAMTPKSQPDFTFIFIFKGKEYTLWTHADIYPDDTLYPIVYEEPDFTEFGSGCTISVDNKGTFSVFGPYDPAHNDFYNGLISALRDHIELK